MSTKQPKWKVIANLGDVTPLEYGGLFVLIDTTGVYPPEAEVLDPPPDDDGQGSKRYTVYRFILEPCTYDPATDTLSDNPYHPELPAWFANNAAQRAERPQDGKGLESIAESCGTTKAELIAGFCSEDPIARANAWRTVGEYHGWNELDQYPLDLSEKEAKRRYNRKHYRDYDRRPAQQLADAEQAKHAAEDPHCTCPDCVAAHIKQTRPNP